MSISKRPSPEKEGSSVPLSRSRAAPKFFGVPRASAREANAPHTRMRPCASIASPSNEAAVTGKTAIPAAPKEGSSVPLARNRATPGLYTAVPLRGWPEKTSLEHAHDAMLKLVDPEDAYEIHVLLIRHGRRTCTARNPDCPACPLKRMCPYGRRRLAELRG